MLSPHKKEPPTHTLLNPLVFRHREIPVPAGKVGERTRWRDGEELTVRREGVPGGFGADAVEDEGEFGVRGEVGFERCLSVIDDFVGAEGADEIDVLRAAGRCDVLDARVLRCDATLPGVGLGPPRLVLNHWINKIPRQYPRLAMLYV